MARNSWRWCAMALATGAIAFCAFFLHPFQLPASMAVLFGIYVIMGERDFRSTQWLSIVSISLLVGILIFRSGFEGAATQIEQYSLLSAVPTYQPGTRPKSAVFSATSYAALLLPFGTLFLTRAQFQGVLTHDPDERPKFDILPGSLRPAVACALFMAAEYYRYFVFHVRDLNRKSDYGAIFDMYDPASAIFVFSLLFQYVLGYFLMKWIAPELRRWSNP